jgi:riboflavin biosynthesis pyrimidine reductase
MPIKRASPKAKFDTVFGQRRKRAKMLRVGLDARVSANDQQTLAMQNRAMREYAARRGWIIGPGEEGGLTGRVEQMSGEPAQIVQEVAATGAKHFYVDGGITIQEFLRAGQIHHLSITRVPVLIGEGIPLFGSVPQDIKLRHLGTW